MTRDQVESVLHQGNNPNPTGATLTSANGHRKTRVVLRGVWWEVTVLLTLSAQAFLVKGKATVPMYGETACLGSLRVSMEDT